MKIRAARLELRPYEEVKIQRPGELQGQYEKIARCLSLTIFFPSALGMLMVLFVMPSLLGMIPLIIAFSFLHVVLFMGLLAMVSALERPVTQALWHLAWPIQRWWMMNYTPERLLLETRRSVVPELAPLLLELDAEQGILKAGDMCLNLLRPFSISLERGTSPRTLLRVRVSARGSQHSLVLCASIPGPVYWRLRQGLEALPQLEASAVHLEWQQFRRVMGELQPFGEATGQVWPSLLREVFDEEAFAEDAFEEAFAEAA